MFVNLKVNGISCMRYLTPYTLNLADNTNGRSVLSFAIKAPKNIIDISSGMPVTLEDMAEAEDWGYVADATASGEDFGGIDNTVTDSEDYESDDLSNEDLFGGTVETVQSQRIGMVSGWMQYTVRCADWHEITDRRKVAKAYKDTTIGTIIDDFFDSYLTAEGITKGTIDGTDIGVSEAVFNYVSISKAFDKLCEKTGNIWYINPDKSLHFVERTGEDAPWSLTEDEEVKNVVVTSHRQNYRNTQYITDGTIETDEQVETLVGDGSRKTFNVSYDISRAPTITVNSVSKTVGIRGVDEDKDFYWNEGKNTVSAAATYEDTDTIVITYIGLFPVTIKLFDDTQIAERAGIEGGTGIYEEVESKSGLTTLAGLSEEALNKLRQYGAMGNSLSFSTDKVGLEVGQIIPIDLPEHELDTDMLITNITLVENQALGEFSYNCTAVTGEAVGGWTEFFKKLISPQEKISLVNQSENVALLADFSKTWTQEEMPNPFYSLYPSSSLFPAANLYPMFHPGQEVRYMGWDLENVATGRKLRTFQTRTENEIKTTVILFPNDAEGDITDLSWIGGCRASLVLGTGIENDKQEYLQTKTNHMLIQVTHTDTKGW